MQKFGIDTSKWQGDFDFAKAKKEYGVEFAILKIGGGDSGLYKDKQFDSSYEKCEKCGLDKGVYFFGHAMNMDEAKKEAAYLIKLLNGKRFEYPIFYDVEADMLSLSKELLTDICLHVLNELENAGYWAGIYSSQSHFKYEMIDSKLIKYSHWVAKYSMEKPVLLSGAAVQMWQFGGEKNFIRNNMINGQIVDQNYCYVDYPSMIKAKKLNGWNVEEKPEAAAKPNPKPEAIPETKPETIKKGDKVKVVNPINYDNGKKFKVYYDEYDVLKDPEGDRVVIGIGSTVTSAIHIDNIVKVDAAAQPETIKKGDKVKVVNPINYDNGKKFKVYYDEYDVLKDPEGDRVVIGIGSTITSAIHVNNIKKV